MFKYVNDVSSLSQYIIKNYSINYNTAIDGTLGNGHDTDFLSSIFNKVYSFDIQNAAIENYAEKKRENVILIKDCHSKLKEYVKENVDVVMYNLGFLPGGDKSITTEASTTLTSIESSLEILNSGGIITIAIYIGHEEGEKEGKEILEYVSRLPKDRYGVMLHKVINRSEKAPQLIVIEKK
ncbi:MAG: class I SAM-dependent methyltransferase [Clostridium argentinense]|uniref:Class I SAM-dependent methyltransferase n=1 Tax=Clostridium faecium TaxID=2762223 RepID=A0ABR8YWY5_9CLOT|nr:MULTISPECIES: class I SAM-dependent methyltransferase [Clostridium]MBD8048786.1 class I SAM-dependent methyltransferase [Clostridium faecium]MBS5824101.1 class I SAM-dependent methyltransferase [Clostridium argentinense]MDU1350192.1 class I SAM-dependent methyltransferase [Clostridium argentinense]